MPEFTVVNVYVYIFKKIRPKDIKLKIKQLPGKEIYDVPKAYKYYDYEKGKLYALTEKGFVESIDFNPGQKNNYLFCKKG